MQQLGYRFEYPVVVRVRRGTEGAYEIVCGVGRHAIARSRRRHRVSVVVRRFDDDNGARAYAIKGNLFNTAASSRT
jgi:ParB-like chromosome segregation protein Spo0J